MNSPDSEPTLRGFATGVRVFARYTLAHRLGVGGMGEVWLARDESLATDVCLKFLPPHVRWSPAALAAHKAEALRARALAHPHIVRVHDFAEDAAHAAIVMEFVDGRTLAAERLARPGGVLTPAEITAWLPQLAAALDYLHREAHVAHGDVKPANVLLRRDGVVKLADFGVARDLGGRGEADAGGTLAYLSPQRVLGAAPTPADDIYAFGALLYELLTGRPPFFEGDVAAQIELLAPESLAARRRRLGVPAPDAVPPAWERAIQSCLAKRAADRPVSAGEFTSEVGGHVPVPAWKRSSVFVASLAASLVAVAAAWWWRSSVTSPENSSHSSPPAAAASPVQFSEFLDDFVSGFGGWLVWGDPRPQRIGSFQGRRWVLDNNGDGMHTSGLTSLTRFDLPGGFSLESDVFLHVTNPTGCHCEAYIALTREPERWMNALGSSGDSGSGIEIGLNYAGDACWGTTDEWRRHLGWSFSFLAEDGQPAYGGGVLPRQRLLADTFMNRWVTVRIEVDAERRVRFLADGKVLWEPEAKLHPDVLRGQRLVVKGRSLGSAGKAYHDWVRLRAAGATGTRHYDGLASSPLGIALVWSERDWTVFTDRRTDAQFWREAESGGILSLASEDAGGVIGLRSRVRLKGQSAAYFEIQPLLGSRRNGGDRARLGFAVADGVTGGRFVGIELEAGVAWMVDTARNGAARRVRRMGNYAAGSWQAYSLILTATGSLDAVGSLMEGFNYQLGEPPRDGWLVEVSVHDSSDGAAFRPVRLSLPPGHGR